MFYECFECSVVVVFFPYKVNKKEEKKKRKEKRKQFKNIIVYKFTVQMLMAERRYNVLVTKITMIIMVSRT